MTFQLTVSELADMIDHASNTKPVDEFITYIKEKLEISIKNWRLIANALAEASEMYSVDSDAYRRLLKATNFSKSKAAKLVAIATSKRLKTYENQFRCVQSWSTLYEVTTLNDTQFTALREKYDLDNRDVNPVLTEASVKAFKRVKTEKSVFKRIAYISVDEDALRGNLIAGIEHDILIETLKQLSEISPYFKIEESDVFDKQSSLYYKQLETKVATLTHKQLNQCIKRALERTPRKHKNETSAQQLLRCFSTTREELHESIRSDNSLQAFSLLGFEDEYDMSKLYDYAADDLSNSSHKFAARAQKRANTADPKIA